jgi:DNA processing protein
MNACDACLRDSVLYNETLRYAERKFTSTVDASTLLRMTAEDKLDTLRRLDPGIDDRIARQIDDLLSVRTPGIGLVWTLCDHSDEYPARLRLLKDPPPVLYGVGQQERMFELTEFNGLAIVGARRASAYGREVAYSMGNEASAIGLTVVSGMALGIDGAAHRGALQGGGRTIAVLAGGPETPYPRSHRLLHEQIAAVGCVVSESPPGTSAKRWAFVARNRIIAGLAAMTVFVEGSETSGAGHTVKFAEQVEAAVGCVPGPVTSPLSAGPNAILREEGGRVIRDIADVIETLAIELDRPQLPGINAAALEGVKAEVLECVATGENHPRAISQALPHRDIRELIRALGELELIGAISRDGAGNYQAKIPPGGN